MGLETGNSIGDLVATNPTPGDPKSEGDDHIRLIKSILKATFPAFTGPMPVAHDQVASKDFVNQAAFSAVLPGQPGGMTPYRLISVNGVATWQLDSTFAVGERLAEAHAIALSF